VDDPADALGGDPVQLISLHIAASLLVPGNPTPRLPPAVTDLYAYCSPFALNGVLRPLIANGHESVLAAICYLAAHLDTHGSPIEYQRRRALIPAEVITEPEWQDLCGRAGAHPGRPGAHPGEARRLLDARRYLYQLLTGADLHDPRHKMVFRSGLDLSRYYEFTDPMTGPLRAALHDHARQILDHLGIDEPITWEPPPDCCGHLVLPGRDPTDIDRQAVQQLVIVEEFPVGLAARRLGTSNYHVRFALESMSRPARQWSRSTPPSAWARRHQAPQILTREFFEREYLNAGRTLSQLAAETGFSRPLIAEHARGAGISLDHYSPPVADIDEDWLREQYQVKQRSYTDIAAELGVAVMTVHGAAQRHGITSRPSGIRSHPEMITKLGTGVPRDIRRAVEGSLQGWHRLRRFQAAMTFPTIEAAASSLGAHQSALVHQFKRLERDVGAKLYYRSTPHQAMRPTRRGTALLRALDRAMLEICG
jgi:Bacterial regulatory helix-turn-helix protein, lysR family